MSTERQKVRELIDACRSGRDDLELPEMRPLADRIQQDPKLQQLLARSQETDASVKTAMNHVCVPDGLATRLLAAVESGRSATGAAVEKALEADITTPDQEEMPGRRTRPRQAVLGWKTLAVSVVAAVAATVALIMAWPKGPGPITDETLANRVPNWQQGLQDDGWQTAGFPIEQFPPSRLLLLGPRRWQEVPSSTSFDSIVCYDLTRHRRNRVLLFVLRTQRVAQLPALPPGTPDSDTLGLCIGSWHEGEVIYSASVDGKATYRELIRSTQGIAAAR